jgi:hypothetical protein
VLVDPSTKKPRAEKFDSKNDALIWLSGFNAKGFPLVLNPVQVQKVRSYIVKKQDDTPESTGRFYTAASGDSVELFRHKYLVSTSVFIKNHDDKTSWNKHTRRKAISTVTARLEKGVVQELWLAKKDLKATFVSHAYSDVCHLQKKVE